MFGFGNWGPVLLVVVNGSVKVALWCLANLVLSAEVVRMFHMKAVPGSVMRELIGLDNKLMEEVPVRVLVQIGTSQT